MRSNELGITIQVDFTCVLLYAERTLKLSTYMVRERDLCISRTYCYE
jgi:hypothetical protein